MAKLAREEKQREMGIGADGKKKNDPEAIDIDADTEELQDLLTSQLGLAVRLNFNHKSKKGNIQIRTTSLEQFEAVVKLLQK